MITELGAMALGFAAGIVFTWNGQPEDKVAIAFSIAIAISLVVIGYNWGKFLTEHKRK